MTNKVVFTVQTATDKRLPVIYCRKVLKFGACISGTQFTISIWKPITSQKSETAIPRNIDVSRIRNTISGLRYSQWWLLLYVKCSDNFNCRFSGNYQEVLNDATAAVKMEPTLSKAIETGKIHRGYLIVRTPPIHLQTPLICVKKSITIIPNCWDSIVINKPNENHLLQSVQFLQQSDSFKSLLKAAIFRMTSHRKQKLEQSWRNIRKKTETWTQFWLNWTQSATSCKPSNIKSTAEAVPKCLSKVFL